MEPQNVSIQRSSSRPSKWRASSPFIPRMDGPTVSCREIDKPKGSKFGTGQSGVSEGILFVTHCSVPRTSADSSITPDPPIDLTQQANISPVAGNRPSAGKHIFRVVVSGLSIAIVVAVVWLTSRDDQTRNLVKLWGHSSVIWLSSALGTPGRDSEAAAKPSSKDQAASTPMATSTPSKEFAELQERLQTVVNDPLSFGVTSSSYLSSRSEGSETVRQRSRPNRMLPKKHLR